MVIYADVLVVLNAWVDYLLLLGVNRATGGGTKPWRLILGALIGGLSGLAVFLPPLPWWASLLVKAATAVLMIAAAFSFAPWRLFLRRSVLLFVFSAGFAGVCGALYFFVAPPGFAVVNGVVYYAVPPLLLVALTAVCYIAMWVAERLCRVRAPMGRSYTVRVTVDDRTAAVRCLYDSGDHLTDPFSGKPVLILERAAAETLLPVPSDTVAAAQAPGWHLIPYGSLGGNGVLPAFSPRSVAVKTAAGETPLPPCLVAVCEHLGRGDYRGLIGTAFGDWLTE